MGLDWMPFASAGFGALAGGSLSLVGSVLVSRWADRRREEQGDRAALAAVSAEMRANLRVVEKPETLTTNVLVTFSDEAWKEGKGTISSLGHETETVVHAAYADLALSNAVANQNIHLSYGAGYLNDRYKEHVRNMECGFRKAIPQIEERLKRKG